MASIVGMENIPTSGTDDKSKMMAAMNVFTKRERHKGKTRPITNPAFHIAVNPGGDDAITDDECVAFAKGLLDYLGLKDQPYVIYQHKDIEREHFHIVGSRIKEDGYVVRDCFSYGKCVNFCKMNEQFYHYCFGKPIWMGEKQELVPESIRPGQRNIVGQIIADYEDCLKYNFTTFEQFRLLMRRYNIGVEEKLARGSKTQKILAFYGIDKDGNRLTNRFSAGRDFKKIAYGLFCDRMKENRERWTRDYEDAQTYKVNHNFMIFALVRATSLRQLEFLLNSCGIEVFFVKDGKVGGTPENHDDIFFVRALNKRIFNPTMYIGDIAQRIRRLPPSSAKDNVGFSDADFRDIHKFMKEQDDIWRNRNRNRTEPSMGGGVKIR